MASDSEQSVIQLRDDENSVKKKLCRTQLTKNFCVTCPICRISHLVYNISASLSGLSLDCICEDHKQPQKTIVAELVKYQGSSTLGVKRRHD